MVFGPLLPMASGTTLSARRSEGPSDLMLPLSVVVDPLRSDRSASTSRRTGQVKPRQLWRHIQGGAYLRLSP